MHDLKLLSVSELLDSTKQVVADERKATLLLIDHLREIENRSLHLEMAYPSLWDFCVNYLGLSEGSAQRRINAMRLSREIPEVKESLESGKLNLTAVAQLQGFFKQEQKRGEFYSEVQKREIVQSMEGLSKREVDLKLVQLSPTAPIVKEGNRVVSDEKTELRILINHEEFKKLKLLKDYLGHKFPDATNGELIGYLIEKELAEIEKKRSGKGVSQVKKKENTQNEKHLEDKRVRNSEKVEKIVTENVKDENLLEVKKTPLAGKNSDEVATNSEALPDLPEWGFSKDRIYISVSMQRHLWRRAQGRCEFTSKDGNRCTSCYRLEIDHKIPLYLGGTNEVSNLHYVYKSHNLYLAQKILGHEFMQPYLGR